MNAALLDGLERLALPGGQPVLIACSAGADSTALARVAAPWFTGRGHPVCLLHFDHRWRDGSADRAFVRALAASLGVPCVEGAGRDPDLEALVGREAAARSCRLPFLEAQAAQTDGVVLLGHHRDDQIETALIRVLRREPVVAMPAARGPLRRPWLDIPKSQLARFAGPHRRDPTQADDSLLRNRARRLLPLLRARAPDLDRALLDAAAAGRARVDAQQTAVDAAWPRLDRGAGTLDRRHLAALSPDVAVAALRRLVPVPGGRGPSAAALHAVVASASRPGSGRSHDLGGGWTARVERGAVIASPRPSSPRSGGSSLAPRHPGSRPPVLLYTPASSPAGDAHPSGSPTA